MPSKLQAEIRQNKPFRSPAEEAVLSLLRTADFVRRKISQAAAPYDLSLEQYNVLRILRGAGPDGMATLEISERMIERSPAMTRLLDKLEAKVLVRRQRCPEDRRKVMCWISDEGRKLLQDLDEPLTVAGLESVQALGAEELTTLIRLLDQLRQESEGCFCDQIHDMSSIDVCGNGH